MPPKASSSNLPSPNSRKKAAPTIAKSDPFGGMLSLTGSALTTQQLQQESASSPKKSNSKNNNQEDLIGVEDTTIPTKKNQKNEEDNQEANEKTTTVVERNNENNNNDLDDDNDENGEEEEILCSNNVGTAEDREFDALIGTIESFLVSDELESARQNFFSSLPNPEAAADLPQQEKYIFFKKYVGFLDDLLDKFVTAKLPGKSIEDFAEMILARQDEVSMDVLELVSGGEESGLDYESFVQMWELYSASPSSQPTGQDDDDAEVEEEKKE